MHFSALRDRAVGAMRNYLNRGYNVEAMLDFGETPDVRNHLNEFYSALRCVSVSSALGSLASFTGVFGLVAAFIACWMFHAFHLVAPAQKRRRVRLLVYCAFFLWGCVTPWLTWLLGVDKGLVVSTILAAWAGFVSVGYCFGRPNYELVYAFWIAQGFSCQAVFVSLYLTAVAFDGDSALWSYQMYLVVTTFMVYVAAYSREVMVRARGGDADYAKHALHLYTHFPSFVVHVLSRGAWNNRYEEVDDHTS